MAQRHRSQDEAAPKNKHLRAAADIDRQAHSDGGWQRDVEARGGFLGLSERSDPQTCANHQDKFNHGET